MQVPEGYYAILFEDPASGAVGVRFPEHPGVITYGQDDDDAEEMACETLGAALETDFDRGLVLPPSQEPTTKQGERVVFVPLEPDIRMAYLLRGWREEAGVTQKDMAQRMGISTQAYRRMERPGRSNLTVSTLNRVARALGRRLVLELRG